MSEPREAEKQADQTTLGELLDQYIAKHDKVKAGTATVYGQVRRCLVDYFGADKPLAEITAGDAEDWRGWLVRAKNDKKPKDGGQGLGDNTARRRCGIAKQFFAYAVDHELIDRNPFGKMKKLGVQANRSRDYFLSREDSAKVLDACPDAQWRLLFALSRFGGLRCPSEHLALRWADVDWERGRITVRAPKTEHHEGKAERTIPMFPELRRHLQDAWDPEAVYVITRYRASNSNLRTQFERIIYRAGLIPWPKLFQNLRATRETELAEQFPSHVVCEWIGHSQAVATKHYLQTTDDHFAAAIQGPPETLHKPLQTVADTTGQTPTEKTVVLTNLGNNDTYSTYTNVKVVREGFEPPTKGL